MTLEKMGFVNIAYPQHLRAAVENAIVSWRVFCILPSEIKTQFAYCNEGQPSGSGYELKEEKGSKRDLKENFQVNLGHYARLDAIAKKVNNPQALRFIHDAHQLIRLATPLIEQFAINLQETYGIEGLVADTLDNINYWILRYLHYFGDRHVGEEIAAPHADKCGFTLHLYESDAGLQYLDIHTREWRPMPVHAGQTAIIPSMQVQLRSNGQLRALYHRVVATERTAQIGRFSMVCFVDLTRTPVYNKSALGRMQDYQVGFNYDLAPTDFSKLFS